MAPEDPISDPTIVSMGLLSMNPSAHSAHPLYELSTVIATGISADPIDLVIFHPSAAEAAVVVISDMSPIAYDGLVIMATNPIALAAASGALMYSLNGRSSPFLRYQIKRDKQ